MNSPKWVRFDVVYKCENGHEQVENETSLEEAAGKYAYEDADECPEYKCHGFVTFDRIEAVEDGSLLDDAGDV